MCYVPGSHKWGLTPNTGLTGDINAAHKVLSPTELEAFEGRRPMELRRGECQFHHSMMMHGSYTNRSDKPRRATVINVFRDGVLSNMDGDKQGDMGKFDWIRRGEPCEGQYYPQLFEAARELGTRAGSLPRNEGVELDLAQFDRWMAALDTDWQGKGRL